jgi:hypothetical protein
MKANICFNKMCGSKSVTLESAFKYIIKSVVQVVGYLYIMDLSNARKMEQIKSVFFLCTLEGDRASILRCDEKENTLPCLQPNYAHSSKMAKSCNKLSRNRVPRINNF